jgi:hypothetical protein
VAMNDALPGQLGLLPEYTVPTEAEVAEAARKTMVKNRIMYLMNLAGLALVQGQVLNAGLLVRKSLALSITLHTGVHHAGR